MEGYFAAGAVVDAAVELFFPFFPFFPFLCAFWVVLAAGVVPEVVPCAKARPVVLPKNNTVIKAAINFFISILQALSGSFYLLLLFWDHCCSLADKTGQGS